MITGDEKCSECKEVSFPRGFDSVSRLCWFCSFPSVSLVLSDAQRAHIEGAWREALA